MFTQLKATNENFAYGHPMRYGNEMMAKEYIGLLSQVDLYK